MKITQNAPIRSTSIRRSGKSSAGRSGQFTDHLVTGEAGAPTGNSNSSTPVSAVDSLLVLQEVPDATSGTSRAKLRAQDLLDQLDEVRHGLLAGALSRRMLDRLARIARSERQSVDDPRLQELLDEIELRAAVELAKYSSR
ncbi:MAG: flagellar assembly protein FliX [Proteobacteria bacterium]|nr:flagellar assembly protein FliX [Pseudomonadota bacterium]TDI60280.1 MAG: flagellar assembly protein FliX [Alphaproteobacteria bacterium]